MFCVECGKEGDLIGPLCPECHSKKHVKVSLPEHIDITVCGHCSAFLIGGAWKETDSVREAAEEATRLALSLPKDVSLEGLTVQLEERDEHTYEARVAVSVTSHGHPFERDATTTIRLKHGSCKECSKQMGSYYEAILQIRGDRQSLDEVTEARVRQMVEARVDALRAESRASFVTKVERVRGGLDYYLGASRAGRLIARELQEAFCAEYKESSSLWGQREGKDVYRVTFLVRLPGFSVGDVVTDGKRDLLVRGMSKGHVRVVDLTTGEETQQRFRSADQFQVVCPASGIRPAVVLMESPEELQVLDPDTMASVDIRKPRGFTREGEQVRIVKTKLGTYALSDDW